MTDAWLPLDEEAHRQWADAADWVRGGDEGRRFRQEVAAAFDDARTWVDPSGYRLSDRIWNARETDRRAIDGVLRQMIANGTDSIEAAKQVEAYLLPTARNTTVTPRGGRGMYSARRLTRTEMTRAYGAATIRSADANPFVQGVRWNLSGSHPEADVCDPNAGEDQFGLGEGVYPPDQVPRYPAHPHCFPVGTPVTTTNGLVAIEAVRIGQEVLTHEGRWRRVTGMHWRDHDGPMVSIRWNEGELLASPEHPVLTQRGWVEAACLQPGDHLCRATGGVRHDAFVGEVQNLPSRLAQFLVAHGIGTVRVPAHAVAFNDEAGGVDHKVRPAATDPVAMLGGQASVGQRPLHHPLDAGPAVGAGHPGVQMLDLAGGQLAAMRLGHPGTERRIGHRVAVASLGCADLGADIGPLGRVPLAGQVAGRIDGAERGRRGSPTFVRALPGQGHSVGDGPHRDAEPAEQVAQHPEGHAGRGADGGRALPLLQVHAPQDGLGILTELGGDALDVPVLGLFAAVSHVSILPRWTGRLWNLEVAEDHTYAVAGVVVHNCLCTLSQVTVDDETALAQIIQEMRATRAAQIDAGNVVDALAPVARIAASRVDDAWTSRIAAIRTKAPDDITLDEVQEAGRLVRERVVARLSPDVEASVRAWAEAEARVAAAAVDDLVRLKAERDIARLRLIAPDRVAEYERLRAESDRLAGVMANAGSKAEWMAAKRAKGKAQDAMDDLFDAPDPLAAMVREELRQARPFGSVAEHSWTDATSANMAAMTQEVAANFPTEWWEQSVARSASRPMWGRVVARGHYNRNRSNPEFFVSGKYRRDNRAVAAHEFGHRMEHVRPSIVDREAEFYVRRTAGESARRLGGGYKSNEVTKRDAFYTPYVGKEYPGQFADVGGRYVLKSEAYEVLTMGVQDIAGDRQPPYWLLTDPDYADFILGMLAVG